tara:strand:- start:1034 stop:1363 length:330 start_codon:yes stop_codon:yes gene_type:complete
VFVGNGLPAMAEDFIEQFNIRSPVYVDPARILYKALGFNASKMKMLSPSMVLSGMKAAKKGFIQGKLQGDPWQLGGVVLLHPSGEIPYVYRSAFAGDHPDVDDVIARLV